MNYLKRICLVCTFAVSICNLLYPQSAKISITSNVDSTIIFIDTLFLGYTPITNFEIKPGNYVIKGISKKIGEWSAEIIEKEIKINTDDSMHLDFKFKKRLKILTEPENAKIFSHNITLGNSPINIFYKPNDTLKIEKENYAEETILLDSIKGESIKIILKTKNNIDSSHMNDLTIRKNNGSNLTYYIIGGGLVFGIVAVITKANADHLETEYRSNKDQNTKNKIRLYDTFSGISLMLFESCFLTLSYLLLSN
jgi:hypothetical protein